VPEGDTIFKVAAALRPLLVGQPVLAAHARTPGPAIERVIGSSVVGVEPMGKHLVIRFSNGLALHTHLRMAGTWHRYAHGERWRKPAWQARVVLQVPEYVVVCFNAPVVELMNERAVVLHPALQQLGPDLLDPAFDAAAAVERLQARPAMPIAEALLDQRALAGIGNIFKSEILFLEGVNPFLFVSDLRVETLHRLVATAQHLLTHNVRPGAPARITTRDAASPSTHPSAPRAPELWVYNRTRRPCLRCRTPIQSRRQGAHNRMTYWCPTCQPVD
jgi:endonuclease-8